MAGQNRFASVGLLSLIGALLLGSACGGPSFNFTGHWTGRRDLPKKPDDNAVILNSIAKVDLELRPDGRFELLEGGVPRSGSYRVDGRDAYLRVTHFMNRPIEDQGQTAVKLNQEIELKAQNDGSITLRDPAGFTKDSVKLVREKSESQPAP